MNALLNKFKTTGHSGSNAKKKNNTSAKKEKEQIEKNKSFKSAENQEGNFTIKNLEQNFENLANDNKLKKINPHLKVHHF